MKKLVALVAASLFTLSLAVRAEDAPAPAPAPAPSPAVTPATAPEAAGIGAWTTDFDAAQKVSAERHLPLFIEFTGSDWCGWCKKMEEECLSKPEFLEAMKTRCVLVSIDFPHKTVLSPALKAQNSKVADEFKKSRGFPSYVLVDSDGKTVRWNFGAHPKYGKDLKLLISDIDGFTAACEGNVSRATAKLAEDAAKAYRDEVAVYAAKQQEVLAWLASNPKGPESKTKFAAFQDELKASRDKMSALLPK